MDRMDETTTTAMEMAMVMEREGGMNGRSMIIKNDRINSIDQSINQQSLDRQSVPAGEDEDDKKEGRKEGKKDGGPYPTTLPEH